MVSTDKECCGMALCKLTYHAQALSAKQREPIIKKQMKIVREPELAEMLSVCQRTLRLWRDKRLIPFLKINRVVMYDVERVREALTRFERKEAVK